MHLPMQGRSLLLAAVFASLAHAKCPAEPGKSLVVPGDEAALGELYSLIGLASASDRARLASAETDPKCTSDNVVVRKQWGSMSREERIAYTDAVLCLQELPAKTPTSEVPGAKSRFDDFLAIHIQKTQEIHYTGNFLSWHRWFTYTYEQALRDECGYKGSQPWWNWPLFAADPSSSPIFDGSETSMSGNGAPIPNKGPITLLLGDFAPVVLPPGTGGGCVTSGPFANMTVSLGPVALPLNNGTVLTGSGLSANPRCLKRDISAGVSSDYSTAAEVIKLLTTTKNIEEFQMLMQGIPGSGRIGVHGGGHYTIGGDPAGDTFTSPGDPVFYLHHSMIDLVWWVWQNLGLRYGSTREARTQEIAQTRTFLNMPPSGNATLDDLLDLGYAGGGQINIRDVVDNLGGPFCYTYEL